MLETYQRVTNRLVHRVNEQRGINNRLRDAVAPQKIRVQFMEAVGLAYKAGLAVGLQAEASQRLKGNKFLITAEQSWFGRLTEDGLGIAALDDNFPLMAERLPRHVGWHSLAYRTTAAQAALLCQPTAATAVFLQTSPPFPPPEELMLAVGGIAYSDSETAVNEISLSDYNILLIRGIGLLALGETLIHAIARAETVNRWCEIQLLNKQ